MIFEQVTLQLSPVKRGFHLITQEVVEAIPALNSCRVGLLHVFIKHTSASLSINEDADPSVRRDFERVFNRLIPENEPYYEHTDEGSDDMPAHLKASIIGADLTIPVSDGTLNMGTWQGIYLCEHRNHGGPRSIVITLHGKN